MPPQALICFTKPQTCLCPHRVLTSSTTAAGSFKPPPSLTVSSSFHHHHTTLNTAIDKTTFPSLSAAKYSRHSHLIPLPTLPPLKAPFQEPNPSTKPRYKTLIPKHPSPRNTVYPMNSKKNQPSNKPTVFWLSPVPQGPRKHNQLLTRWRPAFLKAMYAD